MTSNNGFIRICEYCGKEFLGKTAFTRYCSKQCNGKHYKQIKRRKKLTETEKAIKLQKEIMKGNPLLETIQKKEFLSIREAASLIGVSESTIFRLMKKNILKATKIGRRTILSRQQIDSLFHTSNLNSYENHPTRKKE